MLTKARTPTGLGKNTFVVGKRLCEWFRAHLGIFTKVYLLEDMAVDLQDGARQPFHPLWIVLPRIEVCIRLCQRESVEAMEGWSVGLRRKGLVSVRTWFLSGSIA